MVVEVETTTAQTEARITTVVLVGIRTQCHMILTALAVESSRGPCPTITGVRRSRRLLMTILEVVAAAAAAEEEEAGVR